MRHGSESVQNRRITSLKCLRLAVKNFVLSRCPEKRPGFINFCAVQHKFFSAVAAMACCATPTSRQYYERRIADLQQT
jgi:hypothetical protein